MSEYSEQINHVAQPTTLSHFRQFRRQSIMQNSDCAIQVNDLSLVIILLGLKRWVIR